MRFSIQEDPRTPKDVYNWRVYLSAIVAGCGALLFGYDSAFIGSLLSLPSFRRQFGLDTLSTKEYADTSANIVSIFQAGCFFGVIFAYPWGERFGRRSVIAGAAVLFVVGSIIQLVSRSLAPFYLSRVLNGLAVGGITIAEIAPPAIRGQLIGFYEVAYQVAALLGFWHMSPKGDSQWMVPVSIQLIPGGLLFIGTFFIPESPRQLAKRGNYPKALTSLSWLRNLPQDHSYVNEELFQIRQQIEHETMGLAGQKSGARRLFVAQVKELGKKGIYNRLIVGSLLMLYQNATGINASSTIFKSIGVTGTNAGLFATGIYGVVKLVSSLIFLLFLIDRVGRRLPLLIGGTASCLCLYYIGAYIKIANPQPVAGATPDSAGISAIAMLYIFVIFYCASINGIAWIYNGELFPTNIRGLCAVVTTCFQWIGQFAITRATPYMFESFKSYGPFLFFGSCTLVGTTWVYFFIKETKGVSLEDMDKLWGYDRSATNGGREVNDGERKEVREDEEAKSMSMSSSSDAWEKEQEERVEGSKMEA
ncbi:general substrate transporter [Atractiella rhizophila]|nr:general substrate transporter [Atractiella rhizophila]